MIASSPLATLLPAVSGTAPAAPSPGADSPARSDGLFASLLGTAAAPVAPTTDSPLPLLTDAEALPSEPLPGNTLELPTDPLALLVWLPWMQAGAAPAADGASGSAGESSAVAGMTLTLGSARLAVAGEPVTPAALPFAGAVLPGGMTSAVAAAAATGTTLPTAPPAPTGSVLPAALSSEDGAAKLLAAPAQPAPATRNEQASLAALRAELIVQPTRQTLANEPPLATVGAERIDAGTDPLLGTGRSSEPSGPRPTFELSLPQAPAQRSAGAFGEAVESRLQWMAERGIGRAQIRLSPAELGTIDIDLKLDGKQIRAEFISNNAEVRQMLESQLPRLRDMLQASGMQLTDASVGGQKDAPSGDGASRDGAGAGTAAAWSTTDAGGDAEPVVRSQLRQRDGLLDEYA
jgi:flagellar hook-length control protein FliK